MSNVRRCTLLLALTSALALTACGDDAAAPLADVGKSGAPVVQMAEKGASSSTGLGPVETTLETARLFKANDVAGLMRQVLPKAQYDEIAGKWNEGRKDPITEQQRKEFSEGLATLTAPDAVDKLMAQAEPMLANYKAQAPILIAGGLASLSQQMQSNPDMNEDQKKQATQMITALSAWSSKTDLTDPARLRKFLTESANALKATKVTSLDQLKEMNFEQLMAKAGLLVGGMKRGFMAYDMNMDEMFSSIKAEQISLEGDKAKIRTTANFLGTSIVSESEMIKVDGRWYAKDSIEGLKKINESMGKVGG